jgi:hypothetical protein
VLREGGKIVTIPLAPRTARAIDLAISERLNGPTFPCPRAADGPILCLADRAPRRPTSRSEQTDRTPRPAPRHHYRRPRRRRPPARRPGNCLSRRPENYEALGPGQSLARPLRHIHRRRVLGRRSPLNDRRGVARAFTGDARPSRRSARNHRYDARSAKSSSPRFALGDGRLPLEANGGGGAMPTEQAKGLPKRALESLHLGQSFAEYDSLLTK